MGHHLGPKRGRAAVTLGDVARLAEVSPSTASTVLSGAKSNTRVSAETRERILRASAELGYQPNDVARSLRRRRTDLVGLYLGYGHESVRRIFVSDVVAGIQTGCDEHEKDLVLFGSFRGRNVEPLYAALISGKVDGIILLAPSDDPLAQRLADSHVPVVAIANTVRNMPAVLVDDVQGMSVIATHVAAKGHRKVLYRARDIGVSSAQRRYDAFHERAAELGLEVVDGMTHSSDDEVSEQEKEILALPAKYRPTCAVCWHDISAHRMMSYAAGIGLAVPTDLAVTGFNGQEPSVPTQYRLTTALAPWQEVARRAVSVLMRHLDGSSVPIETVFPVTLREGDTT